MTDPKFLSEEWCSEATNIEHSMGDEVLKIFKKPAQFTHVLQFEVGDRPGVVVQGEYVGGRVKAWTSGNLHPADQVWASFRAKLEHFQEATSGRTPAASLVMGGKIRLVKGSMKDAIENAEALNFLLRSWGTVPTDWDI